MRIRKGDKVRVIAGNDRGKTGVVRAAFPRRGAIAVDGVNIKKKHVRPQRRGQKGQLVRIPAPFPVARAMIVCPSCVMPARIGYHRERGSITRVCKKCGATL